MIRVEFIEKKQESREIWSYYLRPAKPVRYEPGQFTELIIPGVTEADRNRRWFTISSAPGEDHLTITTRHRAPESEYKQALFSTTSSTELFMTDPMGDFVLPMDTDRPLIFIALGLGITPYMSMIKHLSTIQEERNIRLFHAVRREDELLRQEYFRSLPFLRYHPVLIAPTPQEKLEQTVTTEVLQHLLSRGGETLMYIAGPEISAVAVATGLAEAGVPPYNIMTDYFIGSS